MPRSAPPPIALALAALLSMAGCDHGLAPPEIVPGRIVGTVAYTGPWPPADSVQDLRFVAMRFMPRDTTDFTNLSQMEISDRLDYGVEADSFVLDPVDPGVFVYAGVAQRFDTDILSWRPVGLIEENGGLFIVGPGQETRVHVDVDFRRLPVFPPELPGNQP